MADMWESLGFSQSPYDSRPLRPIAEDEELLVNREAEAIEFCTTLDSFEEGFLVISGAPGVGKTSFFNVQQYRLASGKAEFGPKLMPIVRLCSIYPKDDPRKIALRALEGLIRSVQTMCESEGKSVPSNTAKLAKWLNSKGNTGFDIGLQILGIGGNFARSVELPSVDSTSFEGLQDAIECVVNESIDKLDLDGVFIALDNIENLENKELQRVLITFRDTLFTIPRVWWVLIGQSGLGSLIQTIDKRVSDRLTGTGLELKPLSFDELEAAIALRVMKFSKNKDAKSPLPTEIHRTLYDASSGETRFVFKYSHEICSKFVELIRKEVIKQLPSFGRDGKEHLYAIITERFAARLINNQIPFDTAKALLMEIVEQELKQLNLPSECTRVLKKLSELGEARSRDFEIFGFKSRQYFFNRHLSKMHSQNLLSKRQEGIAVYYSLRGVASMAFKFLSIE